MNNYIYKTIQEKPITSDCFNNLMIKIGDFEQFTGKEFVARFDDKKYVFCVEIPCKDPQHKINIEFPIQAVYGWAEFIPERAIQRYDSIISKLIAANYKNDTQYDAISLLDKLCKYEDCIDNLCRRFCLKTEEVKRMSAVMMSNEITNATAMQYLRDLRSSIRDMEQSRNLPPLGIIGQIYNNDRIVDWDGR